MRRIVSLLVAASVAAFSLSGFAAVPKAAEDPNAPVVTAEAPKVSTKAHHAKKPAKKKAKAGKRVKRGHLRRTAR